MSRQCCSCQIPWRYNVNCNSDVPLAPSVTFYGGYLTSFMKGIGNHARSFCQHSMSQNSSIPYSVPVNPGRVPILGQRQIMFYSLCRASLFRHHQHLKTAGKGQDLPVIGTTTSLELGVLWLVRKSDKPKLMRRRMWRITHSEKWKATTGSLYIGRGAQT